jgi:4-azaleucine resistance transporter AzlC
MPYSRTEFFWGVRDELPLLVGVIPFGLIYGVLALSAGIPAGQAQAMSSVIFAGSAQFITAQLFGHGTPALVIVMTAAVVNLRHMLYSASLAPYLQKLKPAWKWTLGYLLTDEAYAVVITRFQREDNPVPGAETADHKHWYFLGAGLALWTTWQLSTATGIFIGAQVPASWSLEFTLALTFIALVVPNLKDRPSLGAALAAGVTAVVAYNLPYKLNLVSAALVGILVGMWMEAKK